MRDARACARRGRVQATPISCVTSNTVPTSSWSAALFPSTDYAFYYPLRELQHQLEVLHRVPLDVNEAGSEPLLILARFTGRSVQGDE